MKNKLIIIGLALVFPAYLLAQTPTLDGFQKQLVELARQVFLLQEKVEDQPILGGGQFINECNLTSTSTQTSATSSTRYLTTGSATSTILTCSTESAEVVDVNFFFYASSTATKFYWKLQFSNNNQDWFDQDASTASANNVEVTHGASGVTHNVTPGSTATTTRNLDVNPVASKYMRVLLNLAGANGSVWLQQVRREPR